VTCFAIAFAFVALACSNASTTQEIDIHLIAFTPQALTVKSGATITWTQHDAGVHTVTSGTASTDATGTIAVHPNKKFDSGKLATGKTFTFRFSHSGSYPYFCEIHPGTMHGVITVR